MPLLSPSQIHQILQKETRRPRNETQSDLSQLLEDANLTAPEVLDNLSSLMRTGETDQVRVRAAETALKLNGLLTPDVAGNNFSVTIVIQDSEFSEFNPILCPIRT